MPILSEMTPEEIYAALKERREARGLDLELPDPPEPGPTWHDVLDLGTTNPTMYAALMTGRARGFEGEALMCFIIIELAKMNKRIWDAFVVAQEQAPGLWRLGKDVKKQGPGTGPLGSLKEE